MHITAGKQGAQGGIRRRMIRLFLPVCLLSLLVCAAVSVWMGLYQLRTAEEGSRSTAELAIRHSEELLLEQGLRAAVQQADAKAESIQGQIDSWIATLYSLRASTASLYSRRELLPPATLPTYREAAAQGERVTMHYGGIPDVAEEELWRQELSFYASLAPFWTALVEHGGTVSSVFITTASGLNISCDANAARKIDYAATELRNRDWYVRARDSGGLYVSGAYQDSFGRGLTVTLSVPLHGDGDYLGVLGMDILIEHIHQDILQTNVAGHGLALLVSAEGKVISPPDLAGQRLRDLMEQENPALSSDKTQAAMFENQPVYAVCRELGGGWRLLLVLPVEDVVAPAHRAAKEIALLAQATRRRMAARLVHAQIFTMAMLSALTLAAAWAARRVARHLADPIARLCRDVEAIGAGNLDYTCTLRTGDEIEQLGRAFQSMTEKLSLHIRELAEITADRERIAAELEVATRIQTGMLPCIFPAFPHREEFDLYATMRPAREVGGDFYDFFLVEEDRLAMVIGDVSGKGVPAALFMVIAKTLIKNQCQMGLEPARVLEAVNRQLCENNDAGLFVTVFLCVLEISTGRLVWANGGHNPPLVRQNGQWTYLQAEPGFVLAGMEEIVYRQESIRLQRGDVILLYTDGVTESQNPQGDLFSAEHLLDLLQTAAPNRTAEKTVEAVVGEVLSFGAGEQADDVTLLALQYETKKNCEEQNYVESGLGYRVLLQEDGMP